VTRNLEDIYDIGTALRAFAQVRRVHPDATLTIAGSGPRREDLERLSAELGVAAGVRFTGRIENERIADLYREADVALNPSTVDNLPNSLLEAMACGVPIVTTDVGGIPYLVQDRSNALLVPPRDPDRMAVAALEVLGSADLAQRLVQAGMDTARRYTWAEVRPVLFGVYARALGLPSLRECAT
jgi:glycosyltransferase involved in cell wall biosynthesis